MKKYFNFFLSALLVLLFGMELSTCCFADNAYGEFTDGEVEQVFSGRYLKAVFLKMQELYDPLSSSMSGKALINKIIEKTTDDEFEILASEIRQKIPRFLNQPYKVSELLFVYNSQTLYLLLPKFYTVQAQNRSNSYTIDWKYLEENSYYLTIGNFYNNDTPSSSANVTLLQSTSSNIFYNGVSAGFTYGTIQNSSGENIYTVSIPYAIGFETSGDTAEDYQSIFFSQINAQPSGLLPRKITSNVILDKSTFEGGTGNINMNQTITGIITNQSGDVTGNFSGEIIGNSNESYWGSSGEINPEDFENQLEENFNGIMENLSGELTQNQIFESLQSGENGFLDFFKEQQNERFYDLAFSWPYIEYMGGVIIPAGGINISEMCREIPELETLRSYIRVIFNFTVAITLIKQIYNLILSTLGIDNPYLYEDYDEVVAIDKDTGEFKEMAYKRRRIYNKRR